MSTTTTGTRARLRGSWELVWRIGFSVLVGLVAFGGVHSPALGGQGPGTGVATTILLLDIAVAPVAVGLLALRRHPAAAVTIVLLSGFSALSLGAGVLAVVSFAAARPLRGVVALGAGFAAVTAATQLLVPDPEIPWWADVVASAAAYAVLVLVGVAVRNRRHLLASLRAQAASARREQEARAEDARRAERAAVAREMHDALGHRLSLIAMHAGALESRPDLSADDTRLAAGVVRESAHRAMSELRGVLGVLDEPSSTRPAGTDVPTLGQLEELVAEGVGGRAAPALRWELDAAAVPEPVSRHLYRMAQEALTNVRKHAPGARTEVVVRWASQGSVELVVRNRLLAAPAPDGRRHHGLSGLAERARLAGGTFTAGDVDGEFVVRAVLPCPR